MYNKRRYKFEVHFFNIDERIKLSVKSLPYFIFVFLYIKGHRLFNPLEGGGF